MLLGVEAKLSDTSEHIAVGLSRALASASMSENTYNAYSTDGYDAFGVGCRDLKTCPGMSWWGYALISVGAVALVGGVTFAVVRQTKKRTADRRKDVAGTGITGSDASYGSI